MKTVIDPHKQIVENAFNMIGKINGLQELYIVPSEPIEFMWGESILQSIMTVDEMREKIGLDPMPIEEQSITRETEEETPETIIPTT